MKEYLVICGYEYIAPYKKWFEKIIHNEDLWEYKNNENISDLEVYDLLKR